MSFRNARFPRKRLPFVHEGESMTQQHFADEVNINKILAKYRKTGVIDHVRRVAAEYGDVRDLAEYATDLDKVAKAQQSFEQLPAEIRNEFGNSIPAFFAFARDEKNKEKLQKWGFIPPDPKTPPKPAPPAAGEPSPQATKTGKIKKAPVINEEEP